MRHAIRPRSIWARWGCLAIWLVATSASAEVRELEVTGAVPAGADAKAGVSVRQAALQEALREGVLRVARELLAAGPAEASELGALFGDDASEYTVRYRILEDRGERRALLVPDPGVETEYVVEASVHVDVDRVRARLEEAGMLASRPLAPSAAYAIRVAGPVRYAFYEALLGVLRDERQVRAATPQLLSRGELRIQVETVVSPTQLAQALRPGLAARGVLLAAARADTEGLWLALQAAPAPAGN